MSHRRGAFLIEVMIAVAIIAVSLLAVYGGVSNEIIRSSNTVRRRTAKNLAQSKLSEILVGEETGSSGEFEDFPEISWSLEEAGVEVGSQQAIELKLTVEFPVLDTQGEEEEEKEALALTTYRAPLR